MIKIYDLIPDSARIGRELIDSEILIELGIEPYVTLECFEKKGCDFLNCSEMNCIHLPECLKRLVYGKYVFYSGY
jgi:hypothetical protein